MIQQEDIKGTIGFITSLTNKRIQKLKAEIAELEKERDAALAKLRAECDHECDPNAFIYDWCVHCGEFLG